MTDERLAPVVEADLGGGYQLGYYLATDEGWTVPVVFRPGCGHLEQSIPAHELDGPLPDIVLLKVWDLW